MVVFETIIKIIDGKQNLEVTYYAHGNPSILLNVFQINVQIETSIASASTTCLTNDNLPTFVLSNCNNTIAPLVVQLFADVCNTQKWPTLWKSVYIIPILKNSNPENVKNYRPISILYQLTLILKRLIFNFKNTRVRPNITSLRHGFMTKRSTITQLLEYLDEIYSNNETSLSVYFDFCKAFDQLPHHILLSKLAKLATITRFSIFLFVSE